MKIVRSSMARMPPWERPDWEGNAMTVASVQLLVGMGVLLLLALIVAARPEVPRRAG